MRTAFVDIDTQLDFIYPSGALYVRGAEEILPAIVRLNRYAAANGIPVLSSADAHDENDPEFHTWPGHCVHGTHGQRKAADTLIASYITIPPTGKVQDFPNAPQFVIEKQQLDVFSNPNFERLLNVLDADRYVVYGVVTELCVSCATLGLLKRGKRVEVVTDATRSLGDAAEADAMRKFTDSGATMTTTDRVISG